MENKKYNMFFFFILLLIIQISSWKSVELPSNTAMGATQTHECNGADNEKCTCNSATGGTCECGCAWTQANYWNTFGITALSGAIKGFIAGGALGLFWGFPNGGFALKRGILKGFGLTSAFGAVIGCVTGVSFALIKNALDIAFP